MKRANKKKTKGSSSDSSDSDSGDSTSETSEYTEGSYDSSDEIEEEEEEEEEELVVEKIIGRRQEFGNLHATEEKDEDDASKEKYYVKFQNKAYIHCQWLTLDEIEELENGTQAFKTYTIRAKHNDLSPSKSIENLMTFEDKEINSNWFCIDRIIDDKPHDSDSDSDSYSDSEPEPDSDDEFLVKWQDLDYTDSTWEKRSDIKEPSKIDEYFARLHHSNPKKIPSRWKRPDISAYKELKEAPAAKNGDILRDYQLEGLNWLRNKWFAKMNNILADEMGLGKTAQIVQMLYDLKLNEGISGPFLVCAPVSTLSHWRNEFDKWTDLNAVVYHGNDECRKMIQRLEFNVLNDKGRIMQDRVQFDVLISNYELVTKEFNMFGKIEWRYVVFDEAHRLKNPNGKLYQKIETLPFEHCTLLTGTPIQNNIEELWALLHLLHPDKFDDLEDFSAKYGNMNNSEKVKEIQDIIKPIMLRRKKSDVEKSIAPKEETIVNVELTRTQKKYYRAFLSENADTLLSQITGGALRSLNNIAMQLRKVCNHPYLINGAERAILEEKMHDESSKGKSQRDIELEAMIMSSGKMVFIDKLLPKLREGDHKVLIFSQMVNVLNIIARFLIERGYKYERLDGNSDNKERTAAIERFNQEPEDFVFLLSTKAGGVGINLTAADTVIIYDSDWNPQNDIQAEARCHRIGQTQKVKVYRLITRDTYESKMFQRATRKLGLDHVVLDGGYMNEEDPMKAEDIEEMLRNGAANIFNDDDSKADEFTSEDIDQILSRRATVTINDVIAGGDSIFAKAHFNADGDDLDLNLDNKDFWSNFFPQGGVSANDLPTMRRCKKMEKSVSVDNDIMKSIRALQNNGYTNTGSEMIVLRESFHIAHSKNEGDEEALKIITRDFPEGDQKEVEKMFGEYGCDIKDSSEKIVTRVAFFYRLKRALFFAQREDASWPCTWEDPYNEYALMVGVNKYGLGGGTDVIFEDDDLDLKNVSEVLRKNRIEGCVRKIIEKVELQYIDELGAEIPPDFTPLPPKEWREAHKNLLSRSTMYDTEIDLLLQAVSSIGIPRKDDAIDIDRIKEESQLSYVTPEAIQNVCEDLLKLCSAVHSEVLEAKEEREEKKKKEKAKEKEMDAKEDGLRRSSRIRESEREREREIVKEREKEKEKEREKEPYDLSPYPSLKPVNGKLTYQNVKKLQASIEDMSKIYKFKTKIGKRRTEIMKNAPKYQLAPDWWTWECDRALIFGIARFGMNSFSRWIVDRDGPFRKQLSQDLIRQFEEKAEEEQRKKKAMKPSDIGDLQFLFNQRSRMQRALTVISFVSKELVKQKKQKEREEKKEEKAKTQPKKSTDYLVYIQGQLRVLSLGKIVNTRAFVKRCTVFPLGFVSERRFKITSSNEPKYWYRCEIQKKDDKPLFIVETVDNPNHFRFEADEPNAVWRMVIEALTTDETERTKKISGAAMFGLHRKEVKEELAKLPGANAVELLTEKPETIGFKIMLKYLPVTVD